MMTRTKLPLQMISAGFAQSLLQFDCAVTADNDPALCASGMLQGASAENKARMNDSLFQMRYGKAQRV